MKYLLDGGAKADTFVFGQVECREQSDSAGHAGRGDRHGSGFSGSGGHGDTLTGPRLGTAGGTADPTRRLLPQEVELFEGSLAENIARLGEPDDTAALEAVQLAHCHPVLMRLPEHYDTAVAEGGANLSAGQRQRVGLARAVYGDPVFVVLDEPDANLDAAGEVALLKTLQTLKQRQATVVLVTHTPRLVRGVGGAGAADRGRGRRRHGGGRARTPDDPASGRRRRGGGACARGQRGAGGRRVGGLAGHPGPSRAGTVGHARGRLTGGTRPVVGGAGGPGGCRVCRGVAEPTR